MSRSFPSAFRAYENAIKYTLKNLHTIPNRRKDWQPPQLRILNYGGGASYSPDSNTINLSANFASRLDEGECEYILKHELRHSLDGKSFLEKILSPRTNTLFRYSPILITASCAIASKLAGGNFLTNEVAITAFATSVLSIVHNDSLRISIPSIYVTSSRGRKKELECDSFATQNFNDINALINIHFHEVLGEAKPKITNLTEAVKACAEFYLTPKLRLPKPEGLISNLLSPKQPRAHPIAGERLRHMIEHLQKTDTIQESTNQR